MWMHPRTTSACGGPWLDEVGELASAEVERDEGTPGVVAEMRRCCTCSAFADV